MTEDKETVVAKKSISNLIVDEDKNTIFHHLAASGNEEEMKIIYSETETKIDTENYLGWTSLMMACRNGHLNVVKLLLNYRADATKKNKYGMSVFLISISSGNLDIVTLILQHLLTGGVSRQSMQRWLSPLSLSILFSDQNILKYLIEQHFDLDMATLETGLTPLMFASAIENNDAFALLLSKGADGTTRNCIGLTAQGIIDCRNKKIEEVHKEAKDPPKQLLPNSAQMHPSDAQLPPYIIVSPQPSFYQLPPTSGIPPHIRKSSNALSPAAYYFTAPNITPIPPLSADALHDNVTPGYYFTTPNVTPITPLNLIPQIFFPPEFSPSNIQINSPVPTICNNNSNDLLNARINNDLFTTRINSNACMNPPQLS
ncbi:hypothetical protein NQ315_003435 [Exocentrus adspersus]|uniref:Uncharacterized protein n=1 Tax=Exocentrus adspersus TaxID=1586481 RepID=A0AAV8VNX4_9CUCU|nr:hypothetical protein NQ315_003435 [Exocentrus adspersus]